MGSLTLGWLMGERWNKDGRDGDYANIEWQGHVENDRHD